MSAKTSLMKLAAAAALLPVFAQSALAQHGHKLSCEDEMRIQKAAKEAHDALQHGAKDVKVVQEKGGVKVLYPETSFGNIVKAFTHSTIAHGAGDGLSSQTKPESEDLSAGAKLLIAVRHPIRAYRNFKEPKPPAPPCSTLN